MFIREITLNLGNVNVLANNLMDSIEANDFLTYEQINFNTTQLFIVPHNLHIEDYKCITKFCDYYGFTVASLKF